MSLSGLVMLHFFDELAFKLAGCHSRLVSLPYLIEDFIYPCPIVTGSVSWIDSLLPNNFPRQHDNGTILTKTVSSVANLKNCCTADKLIQNTERAQNGGPSPKF